MMIFLSLKMYYNERKRKTSGCEADICFSCVISEQTVREADNKALKARVCERDIMNAGQMPKMH
jgi:hypothetical protein